MGGWKEHSGRWMDGWGSHLPPHELRSLVGISTLICLVSSLSGLGGEDGERGRQVRLSMCVFNNRSNREKRRRAGRGTDESRGRADRVWKSLLEMTATLYLHLCTSWWSASTSPSLCVLHTNTTEATTGGHCAEQCTLTCQTVYIPTLDQHKENMCFLGRFLLWGSLVFRDFKCSVKGNSLE